MEPTVHQDTTYVGLNAHKDAISVSMLPPSEARLIEWQLAHEEEAVRRRVKKIRQ